jgi:hypothetical protein
MLNPTVFRAVSPLAPYHPGDQHKSDTSLLPSSYILAQVKAGLDIMNKLIMIEYSQLFSHGFRRDN